MTSLHFLRTALKDYKVGAVTATSGSTVEKILTLLPPQTQRVMEYGAGDGVITRSLLKQLSASATVVAIETNAHFVSALTNIADRRLRVIHNDVLSVLEESGSSERASQDVVISGIPFTLLSHKEREEIVRRTAETLRPGGRFVVYQYSLLMLPYLKKYFPNVQVSFSLRNFPPYFLMNAERA